MENNCKKEEIGPDYAQDVSREKKEEKINEICSSSNRFTQQIYVQLSSSKGKNENLILSGFSLSTAMAMVFLAARDEAQKCFRFHEDLDKHKSGYKDVLARLANCNEDAKLNICQKIFASNRLEIPESFTEQVQNFFGTDPTKIDLADPASTDIVNNWVNKATSGKIETIVAGDDFNPDNLMLLLNAIYFKSDWANKFDRNATKGEDFHLSGDDKVKAQMMTLDNVYLQNMFIQTLDAKAVEFPYKGDQFSMVFILPEKKDGFDEMEQRLGDVDLNNELSFDEYKTKVVKFSIPKFKAESRKHPSSGGTAEESGSQNSFCPRSTQFWWNLQRAKSGNFLGSCQAESCHRSG